MKKSTKIASLLWILLISRWLPISTTLARLKTLWSLTPKDLVLLNGAASALPACIVILITTHGLTSARKTQSVRTEALMVAMLLIFSAVFMALRDLRFAVMLARSLATKQPVQS